ncbi:heme/hemin ABC transporter substrate-binding protein [Vibrio sp. WXL103]|uniref:heme/hemin ABC transporter substrate-binding protein n=1 Tax=Vibrio sp. WXL103 TaxID=3450710 RepID=UPI003EC62228
MKKQLILLAAILLPSLSTHAQDRMVSAGFGVTEIIYALEAQDKLIAADFTSRHLIENDDVSQIGLHVQLNTEGLLSLNPTHLIGTDEMGPKTTLDQIGSAGVEVVTIPSGQDVPHLLSRIMTVADIVEAQESAIHLKQQVQESISEMEKNQCDTKPNAVFFMLDMGSGPRAGGANTAIDTIITLAGGNNPVAEHISGYQAPNMEAIVAMQPEHIIISQRAWDTYNSTEKLLTKLPLMRSTPAGINGNIAVIPSGALLGGFGLASIEVAKDLNRIFCQL